jgi:predicted metal-dependent hydrolase
MTITVLAFYKGTMFPQDIEFENENSYHEAIDLWEQQITLGLRAGFSLKQQIEDYRNQLNEMERRLYEISQQGLTNEEEKIKLQNVFDDWGSFQKAKYLWFANVRCLIKLRQIKDDDMNGFVELAKN